MYVVECSCATNSAAGEILFKRPYSLVQKKTGKLYSCLGKYWKIILAGTLGCSGYPGTSITPLAFQIQITLIRHFGCGSLQCLH